MERTIYQVQHCVQLWGVFYKSLHWNYRNIQGVIASLFCRWSLWLRRTGWMLMFNHSNPWALRPPTIPASSFVFQKKRLSVIALLKRKTCLKNCLFKKDSQPGQDKVKIVITKIKNTWCRGFKFSTFSHLRRLLITSFTHGLQQMFALGLDTAADLVG